jgi:Ca-activated chloride channel family protein
MCSNSRPVVFLIIGFALLLGVDQTKAQGERSSKPIGPLVLTTTVINNKGDLVTGLQKENFQVFLDNKPESIVEFAAINEPISIGILFDASGSTGSDKTTDRKMIKDWQAALKTFLEASNKSNEYFLIAFNYKPQLLTDWSSDANVILNSLSGVRPIGNTAFFDACYLAIEKVQRGHFAKHVLILISDGEDNTSTYSFKQVREALMGSDVLVYSINFLRQLDPGSTFGIDGQENLKKLSSISGGEFFFKKDQFLKVSELVPVFEVIAGELMSQYRVVINPGTSTPDSRWQKIKMKVTAPADARGLMKKLSARTREGVYPNHR